VSLEVDVVIVGGGAAGIGAARRLASARQTTVLLEAEPRLGGRAYTQTVQGHAIDIGCGWLHSAERNSWVRIAAECGVAIDTSRAAWGTQFRELGFTPVEQADAHREFGEWSARLSERPPPGDRAVDALDPQGRWSSYIRAIVNFISGANLETLSAADYVAYDESSTENNWRAPSGYGALIAGAFPAGVDCRLETPVDEIHLRDGGVELRTPRGVLRARAAVLTMSPAVIAGDTVRWPEELAPWRDAARRLPLGHNEKFFFEIQGAAPFEDETHVIGDPRDPVSGAYYLRPFGRPLVEAFLGGDGTRILERGGAPAAHAFALDQLAGLFGESVRKCLHPIAASGWFASPRIGGAYSYALPGQAAARAALATPFDDRIFFAGEATSATDFSTAHGAHDSGVRAAEEILAVLRPRTTPG
jgi:monoamine oxidase